MNINKPVAIIYHKVHKGAKSAYFTKYHQIVDYDTSHTASYVFKVLSKNKISAQIIAITNYKDLSAVAYDKFSCVFNLIDSKELENKAVRFFDTKKIKYTGSDEYGLILSNSKLELKKVLRRNKLLTPRWLIIKKNQNINPYDISLEYPIIVKLANEHCSVGITSQSIAENYTALTRIVGRSKKIFGQSLILEEFIFGREFHATVLENGKNLLTFPLAELTFKDEARNPWNIYGFEEKWAKRKAVYKSCIFIAPPMQLSVSIQNKIQKDVKSAFKYLKFSGYARFDIRYNPNSRRWYFLDANANAGFDPNPREAMTTSIKASGKNMDWYVIQILQHCLKGKD